MSSQATKYRKSPFTIKTKGKKRKAKSPGTFPSDCKSVLKELDHGSWFKQDKNEEALRKITAEKSLQSVSSKKICPSENPACSGASSSLDSDIAEDF